MKIFIKNLARKFGLEMRRFTADRSEIAFLQCLFKAYNIDLVLDVGANIGQYAKMIRHEVGYSGRIVSFEALSSAYHELVSSSKKDGSWEVAPQAALGETDGEIELNISANSQSSSVLKMLNTHLEAAPSSVYIGTESVKMARLDNVAKHYIKNAQSIFLKIDVQGLEMEVVKGAVEILPLVNLIQIELSLQTLYEGQLGFKEMLNNLENLDYTLNGFIPGYTDARTGRMLQVDGIFLKKSFNSV